MTKREGCGFPFFVAQMYARRRVRLRGRALAEKRVFVRQLCRQSFPLRANGFSRSVRRQYSLTFFRLFAPVRLLLLQYLFFVLSAPFVCFRQLRQRLFPFGRTFFCVRMPSVLTFFRPSAFRQTVAFAHVRFSFCNFAVVLRASRCRQTTQKQTVHKGKKPFSQLMINLYDTQKVKQKRLT